jgi:hypothetical protein
MISFVNIIHDCFYQCTVSHVQISVEKRFLYLQQMHITTAQPCKFGKKAFRKAMNL